MRWERVALPKIAARPIMSFFHVAYVVSAVLRQHRVPGSWISDTKIVILSDTTNRRSGVVLANGVGADAECGADAPGRTAWCRTRRRTEGGSGCYTLLVAPGPPLFHRSSWRKLGQAAQCRRSAAAEPPKPRVTTSAPPRADTATARQGGAGRIVPGQKCSMGPLSDDK